MKKLLHALLLTAVPFFATAQVTVSASQYTTEQLVKTVLLNNSNCTSVTNISSNAVTPGATTGIGYFQNNASDFPFINGVLLSTGSATAAGGPIGSVSYSLDYNGDSDLDNFMTQSGTPFTSEDASVIEFDFVAFNSQVSLDYLYASNEYGMYQCGYGDAMLFLLTDTATGTVSNMAVVPNTTLPVSAFSIRSNTVNTYCPSSNPEYFGSYYNNSPSSAPVNFRGVTVPLTAQAAVTPGKAYHLKIVIGDKSDSLFDSAIFLKAGSLNIGTLEDLVISAPNGTTLCGDETTVLKANAGSNYTYQWQYNGTAIANAVSGTLIATQPGDYTVNIVAPDTECSKTETITIIGGTNIPSTLFFPDYTIVLGDNNDFAEFDLAMFGETVIQQLNDPSGYTLTFHESLPDAESGVNSLLSPYTNTQNGQIIYARIQNLSTSCFEAFSFKLIVQEQTPAPTGTADQFFSEGDTVAVLQAEGSAIKWYSAATDGNLIPTETLLSDNTVYYASQTLNNLESYDRLAVTVHLIPAAPIGSPEQTFTEGATLADIEIDGENILWYDNDGTVPPPPTEQSEPLPLTTILEDGKTYYATQTINGVESVQRTAITARLVLALDNNTFNSLQYYPNPVKDLLIISNNGTIDSVNVINLLGQEVIRKEINSDKTEIGVSNLSKGIYIVKIESAGKTKSLKIIKE